MAKELGKIIFAFVTFLAARELGFVGLSGSFLELKVKGYLKT